MWKFLVLQRSLKVHQVVSGGQQYPAWVSIIKTIFEIQVLRYLEDNEQKEQPRSSSSSIEIGSTTTETSRNEEITNEGKLYTSKIRVAESTSEGTPVTTPRGKIA
jgi:hypothetical protein